MPVAATSSTGFLPDFCALSSDLLERVAIAYVCTPGNPQGAVASLDYLRDLTSLARRYGFLLAVDECYSEIYRGQAPAGALEACAALGGPPDRVLVFHSLSKRSSAPGLRAGFVAGDSDLIASFALLRNLGGPQVPGPILAASAALWGDEAHVTTNRDHYATLFDMAERILGNRTNFYSPPGGFYLWLDVGDGEEVAQRALARSRGEDASWLVLWGSQRLRAVRILVNRIFVRPWSTTLRPPRMRLAELRRF